MASQVSAIRAGFQRSAISTLSKPVTASSIRFQDLLDRAHADAAAQKSAFRSQSLAPSSTPVKTDYTVRAGDTLSGICDTALRGRGQVPSAQDVTDAVQKVAAASHITNANRISVGQKLDLTSLSPAPAAGIAKGSESAVSSIKSRSSNSKHSDELSELIQSLVAKRTATSVARSTTAILDEPLQVSSGFGTRSDPFTGAKEMHTGVDLVASSGTAVHPLDAGRVVFSGWQPGYGNTVIVQHTDGTQTLYAHSQKNLVRSGDTVTETSKIALVGSTGRSTGAHLHFEVRKAGTAVDPTPYLRQSQMQIAKAL